MHKKLITNLPFQPSLIGDIALAARQAKRDRVIYSISLVVLLILSLVLFLGYQSAATMSYQQADYSLAPQGFFNKQHVVETCQDARSDYGVVLGKLNIPCHQIKQAQETTLSEAARAAGDQGVGNLTVVNRAPQANNASNAIVLNDRVTLHTSGSTTETMQRYGDDRALIGSHSGGETFILLLSGEKIATTASVQAQTSAQVLADQTSPGYCSTDHDQQCLHYYHRVINETRSIANANKQEAGVGDILHYEFIVENRTNEDQDLSIANDSKSILNKTLLRDLGGGSIVEDKFISWPTQSIAAGETVTKTLVVEIKTESPRFGERSIENTFGNTTSVPLKTTLTQAIVANMQSAASLSGRVVALTMIVLMVLVIVLLLYSRTKENELTTLINSHKGERLPV